MVQRPGHYDGMSKKQLEAFEMCVWRRMGHVKWTDKIKKCCCARKSGRRKNNAGTDEEEKKLAGPLAKKGLSTEGRSRRNGKRKVRGRRIYQMIDNIMINGLYEDTKIKAEKRVEWRMLSLQRKTYPWAEHYYMIYLCV